MGNFGKVGAFGSFGAFGGAETGDFGVLGEEPPVQESDLGAEGFDHPDDDPGDESDLATEALILLSSHQLFNKGGELKDDQGDLGDARLLTGSHLPDLPELEELDEPREGLKNPRDEPADHPLPPALLELDPPPPLLFCRKPKML